jgi:serine/threonine protein kinase
VGSHSDKVPPEKRHQAIYSHFDKIQKLYPYNMQSCVCVSSASGFGFDSLKTLLQSKAVTERQIEAFPAVDHARHEINIFLSRFPASSPPIISLAELSTLLSKIIDRTVHATRNHPLAIRLAILDCLEILGTLVVIRLDSDHKSLCILRPQWLTKLIASIVTFRHNFIKSDGILYHSDLPHIWTDNEQFPAHWHQQMLAVLRQCDVLCEIDNAHSLVPSLLAETPPDILYGWPSKELVRMNQAIHPLSRSFRILQEKDGHTFKVSKFPIGIMPRVIISLLSLDHHTRVFWQQGCMLDVPSLHCLIKTQRADDGLSLTVDVLKLPGDSSLRDVISLFKKICTTITTLSTQFYKIPFEECVDCPDGAECSFSLSSLRESLLKNEDTVCCDRQHKNRVGFIAPDLIFAGAGDEKTGLIVDFSSLRLGQLIGKGAFGVVFRAELPIQKESGDEEMLPVAVKSMRMPGKAKDTEYFEGEEIAHRDEDDGPPKTALDLLKDFQEEVWMMSSFKHSNIVRLVGVTIQPASMILELIPGFIFLLISLFFLFLKFNLGGELFWQLTDPLKFHKVAQFCNILALLVSKYAMQDRFSAVKILPINVEEISVWREIENWFMILQQTLSMKTSQSAVDLSLEIPSWVNALRKFCNGYLSQKSRDSYDSMMDFLDDLDVLKDKCKALLTPIDWTLRLKIAYDIAAGMTYLHTLKPPVLHRDLKSPNIFLTKSLSSFMVDLQTDLEVLGQPLCKVGDFGLSSKVY